MSYIKPISTDPLDNPSHSRLHRIFVADSAAPEDSIQVDASGHTLLVQYEQITINSLGTTTADSLILQNTTAAAAGAQQVSPASRWRGQGWKTTATAASQTVDFRAYVLPVQGTTAPTGSWKLQASINGGAYSDVFAVDSGGAITHAGSITGGALSKYGNFTADAGGGINFQSRLAFSSPSDGNLLIMNWAGNDFGRLMLGGTTASFPALKRNGTGLDLRLADDSGYSSLAASFYVSTGGTFRSNASGRLTFESDGVVSLYNNALSDFGRLNFGGTTSSFPAIKRSGAGLSIRLADDSADATLAVGAITSSGTLALGANSITMSGSIGVTGTRVTKGWFTDLEVTNAPTLGGVAIPSISSTNTFTNKTFGDALLLTQVSTPSNPSSGFNKLYFKSDNKLYKLTSAGVETEVGGSAAATPVMSQFLNFGLLSGSSFDTTTSTGSGAQSTTEDGIYIFSGNTSSSYIKKRFSIAGNSNVKLFSGSPTLSLTLFFNEDSANDGTVFIGLGDVTVAGSSITLTNNHIGFKIQKVAGVINLYATQADGTTENASSALTTVAANDVLDLIFVVNGTASVDYYWRKNGGSLSSATNLTSNLPTASTNYITFAATNLNTGGNIGGRTWGIEYKR